METAGRIFRAVLWVIAILGAIGGAGVIAMGLTSSSSAPQEAAAAGIGLSFAVIPYIIARAVSEIGD